MKLRKEHISGESDEARMGDGHWVYLRDGYCREGDPGSHIIHEDTKRETRRVGVDRCNCAECGKAVTV